MPEGNLRTPAQAQHDIMDWLACLETGKLGMVERPVIKNPLSGEPGEVARRIARYGDYSRMNNRWNAASSDATHARLASAEDVAKFCSRLGRLGFDVVEPQTEGAFVRIYAVRNAKNVDPTVVLPFRGHGP